MPTKFIRLRDAAARVGWHPQHLWKVATDPAYEDVGFPGPLRTGKNSIAFVEAEVEAWIQSRIAERDQQGFQPKAVSPRENARRAKERQQAGSSA